MKFAPILLLVCSLAHAEWGESPGRGCIHLKPKQCVDCQEHAVVVELAPAIKTASVPAAVVDLDMRAFMQEHHLTVPPIMLDASDKAKVAPVVAPEPQPEVLAIFSAFEKEPVGAVLPDINDRQPVRAVIVEDPPTAEQIELARRRMFPPLQDMRAAVAVETFRAPDRGEVSETGTLVRSTRKDCAYALSNGQGAVVLYIQQPENAELLPMVGRRVDISGDLIERTNGVPVISMRRINTSG